MDAARQASLTRLLLDVDAELGIGIADSEIARARAGCRVTIVRVRPGRWELHEDRAHRNGVVGYLIVSGLLSREAVLRENHVLELLGQGDIVQPPAEIEWPRLSSNTAVTAIETTFAGVLDASFIQTAARWPSLIGNLGRRLEQQRERLAIQGLIAHQPQAEHRLLLQLWHLGTHWGRVTPEGITVPFHLTHDMLGLLIGARRSTVTLAARHLDEQGYIRRALGGTWLLAPESEPAVSALIDGGSGRIVGEALMTRHRSLEIKAESQALQAEARRIRGAQPSRSGHR